MADGGAEARAVVAWRMGRVRAAAIGLSCRMMNQTEIDAAKTATANPQRLRRFITVLVDTANFFL
jgi:hypothetical protein